MINNTQRDFNTIGEVTQSWKIPFKDRFRFLLLCKGLTASDLADEIGISKSTISKIMNGWWIPTSAIKIKMAQILGVDSLVIFGDQQYFLDYQKTIQAKKEAVVNSPALNIQNGSTNNQS